MLKYILGLLNSKLLNWYYVENFTNRSALTVNIAKTYLDLLPIKELSEIDQDLIIKLVDKILISKEKGKYDEATKYEKAIDYYLYKTCGLTEEEVAIIEESVGK